MKYILTLLLASTLSVGVAPVGIAKPLAKILRQSGLSPEDFDMMGDAEMRLLQNASPQPGRKASWSNPETASRGTVRVAAIRGNCVYLQHFIHPNGEAKQVELRNSMCKSADGRWLLGTP